MSKAGKNKVSSKIEVVSVEDPSKNTVATTIKRQDCKNKDCVSKIIKTTKARSEKNETSKLIIANPMIKKEKPNIVRYKEKAKSQKKDGAGNLLISLSLISLVLIMIVVGQFFLPNKMDAGQTLLKGTVVNGVDIGGMKISAASEILVDFFKEKANNFELIIKYNEKEWKYNKSDFEVNTEIHTILEQAQKNANINASHETQVEKANELIKQGYSTNVAFNFIFVGLEDKIEQIISEIEVPPTNSVVVFNPDAKNKFEVIEHQNGIKVDKDKLYQDINEQFNLSNVVQVNVKTLEDKALITKEQNEKNTKLISSFKTNVADNTGNRKSNVKLALKHFNGFVVYPGETVSFNKVTGPHSLKNGYKLATIIYNGKYVDGEGGGVCQASTTLYNALLQAGIEITEVHKHSIPVKYVPMSLDAMVSDNVSDLKFKNNKKTPIYIRTFADSNSVYVEIYGEPFEEGVKYATRSEIVKVIPHTGDIIKPDTKKEYIDKIIFKGEQHRLSYPREGYEVKSYLQKFKNDKLVEEKVIRNETYLPSNGIIMEGVEEVVEGMKEISSNVSKIGPSINANEVSAACVYQNATL